MYIRNILLFSCFLFLFPIQINAQNACDGKNLKGKLTFKSITTTKDFDADGKVSRKSERELNYSSDQNIVLYGGRYQLLSKNEKQLDNFTQGNQNHILVGGDYEHGSLMKKSLNFPIEVSVDEKVWEKCDRDLILTRTSKGSGTIKNHNTSTYLNIIKTFSKKYVEEDKMMAEAMEKFHEQVMKERRAQDIKAGKVINEDDYFVPANLYQTHTYGLFLFTYSGQGYGGYTATGAKTKNRRFDCQFDKWVDDTDEDIRLYTNISNGSNGKLEKDYSEDGHIDYYRYVGIDPKEIEDFIKDPKDQTTFTGGSFEYHKANEHESETRTIITLTVYLKDSEEKPGILFTGCENIVVGETATLSAAGKPSSGTYRFWSDGNALSISGLDAQAKITANSSGKTTVWVEYTTPKGEKIKESKTIYSLKVNSINSGNPLQIGLYNIKGKPTNGIKPVSVAVEPAVEITKLTFKPADAAMVSAVPSGQNQLKVQGLKKGKTTVQAYSDCGTQTGPLLNVEILNCDDEVVKELRQQEKMLKSRLESNLKQVAEITGDDEFNRAANNIEKSSKQFFRKMAEMIVAAAGFSKATDGVKTAGQLLDIYNLAEAAVDGKVVDLSMSALIMAAGVKDAIAGSKMGAANTAYEAVKASMDFGRDMGSLNGAAERLEELEEQYTKTLKEYEEIRKILFGICRRDNEPLPDDQPKQSPPNAKEKTNTKVTASGNAKEKKDDSSFDEGGIDMTQNSSDPERSMTFDPEKPKNNVSNDKEKNTNKSGLVNTDTEKCGCSQNNSTANSDLKNLLMDMKNMQQCVSNLEKNTLIPLQNNFKQMEPFLNSLETFRITPESQRGNLLKEIRLLAEPANTKKHSESLLNQLMKFNKENEGCENKMHFDIISNLKINWNKLL